MFISYGRLTWVNTPLDPNMEEMKLPRANRTIIADSILADLDKAVMYLNTQNNSATMRIHKDVARALKVKWPCLKELGKNTIKRK